MRLRPASLAWLLAHDLRLSWRSLADVFTGWSRPSVAIAVIVCLAVTHALAWGVFEFSGGFHLGSTAAATLWGGVAMWMISQGLLAATRQLYERSHLDLLFSSPLQVWKPVGAHAVAIAVSSLASVAPLTLPLANAGALYDGPEWLAAYPILILLALFGTATGFILAVGLFYAAGPRRARRIAQVLAALIAGAFVLAVQLAALLPAKVTAVVGGWMVEVTAFARAYGAGFVPLMQSAFEGDARSLSVALALTVALFVLSVGGLSGAFARAAITAGGLTSDTGSGRIRRRPFGEGVARSLRHKEWRLLVRDPNLFAQLGLQIIYTLPVVVLLLRDPKGMPAEIALTPFIVVLAAQISASLAWIAVSGEDAPELIATAPIGQVMASAAKLSAIAAPVAAILAVPLLVLATFSPVCTLYAVVFAIGAGASTALLNFWHPMAGNRRGMLRRHSQSKVIAMAEHGLAISWALAVVLAMVDLLYAVPALVPVAIIVWLFKPKPAATVPHPRAGLVPAAA